MQNVKRKNGYIELEKLFRNPECKIIDWKNEAEMKSDLSFSKVQSVFSYLGDIWIYKDSNDENTEYLELIAEELAHDFGIPCAYYDLAILNEQEGNISKYFKSKDRKYIFGEQILGDYVENVLKIDKNADPDFYESAVEAHNSLEGIWRALEYRYQNLENREFVIDNLMNQLINIFIYDIFTGQDDRHSYNWGVVESESNISLQLLYDDESIFNEYVEISPLVSENLYIDELEFFVEEDTPSSKALREFIEVSSGEYLERIKSKIPLIETENINRIITRVEKKIHYPIPNNVKEYIRTSFSNILKNILGVIQDYEERLKLK